MALRDSSFSLHLRGHVGPRKAIMDSIRCGSLPVIASDRTPFAFSDGIDYGAFVLRVPERANASRLLTALRNIPNAQLVQMRTTMAAAARILDCGPHGAMAPAVLRRFVRVANRTLHSVPRKTNTPMQLLAL